MSKIFTDEQLAEMKEKETPKENKVLKATMGTLLNPAESGSTESENPYFAETGFFKSTREELEETKTHSVSVRLQPTLYNKYCYIIKKTTGQSFTSAISQHMREVVNKYEETHINGVVKQ